MTAETDGFGRLKTDQFIGGRPVYLDPRRSMFIVEYDDARAMSAPSLAQLREKHEVKLANEQAAKTQQVRQKQRALNPTPVSLVELDRTFTSDGDYMLVGWHATQKTPLLRKEVGHKLRAAGFDPTALHRKKLLNRLTEDEWAQWRALKQAFLQARDNRVGLRKLNPVKYGIKLDGWVLILTPESTYADIAVDDFDEIRVPFKLDGDELVAEVDDTLMPRAVVHPLKVQARAESVEDLANSILTMVHPDAGKPVLVVDRHDHTWRQDLYRPGSHPRQNIYLSLTGQEYDALLAAERDTGRAAQKFIDEHVYGKAEA